MGHHHMMKEEQPNYGYNFKMKNPIFYIKATDSEEVLMKLKIGQEEVLRTRTAH